MSAWGQRERVKCVDAIQCFFFQVAFLSSILSKLFFFSSFVLVEPLSSFAMTASRRGEHCFGGVWQSKNAFPFPLLSADSEQWRGVPGSCPLCRACTSCPDRTHLPDKQNTLSAYEFCTLASSGRPFSKLCYCHFSFDVQSWAGVGPDCFYSQKPGR